MVNDVAEHEGAECGSARQREQFLSALQQRPGGVQLRIASFEQRPRLRHVSRKTAEEIGEGTRRLERCRRIVQIEARQIEDRPAPGRNLDDVRGEIAKRAAALVGFPREFVARHAGEEATGRGHLVIEFGEQPFASGHGR